jgi:DNA-directed RNA polymerase subunit M/transcription elongation factor TFIIS
MAHPMLESETAPTPSSPAAALSHCPQCHARLAILRIIAGKSGSEYWTFRCTRCGGIHLEIVKPSAASPSANPLS